MELKYLIKNDKYGMEMGRQYEVDQEKDQDLMGLEFNAIERLT